MNFQHIRHFVAVAEELHFGRAAERLGMAQPPLSQSIRRLEDFLGCALFSRTHKRVSLTAAGDALLTPAKEILGQIDYARRAVARASESGLSRLTIGYTPNALSVAVPFVMNELKRLAPSVDIKLKEGTTDQQISGVLSGELDIGFIHPTGPTIPGLETRLVKRSNPIAAIPNSWPLAKKAKIYLADLASQPLVMFPADVRPDAHAVLMAAFRRAGLRPHIAQEAVFDDTRLKLVAAGMGVTLVNGGTAPKGYPDVALCKIEDLPEGMEVDIAIAWRRGTPASIRKLFVAAHTAMVTAHPPESA